MNRDYTVVHVASEESRRMSRDGQNFTSADGFPPADVFPRSRYSCLVLIAGSAMRADLLRIQDAGVHGKEVDLLVRGRIIRYRVEDPRARLLKAIEQTSPSGPKEIIIRAPMPGLVKRIETEPGQSLAPGDGILILEAMKMENEIRCPTGAAVKEIRVRTGQNVEKNAILAILREKS